MNDYISRNYLLDEYDRQHQGPPGGARKIIAEAPAEDVVPVVHGRWIWKPTKQYCSPDCWYPPLCHEETWDEKNGTWLENEMYCSECDYNNYHKIKYNFCPNCGAKMDAQEE